MPTVILLEKVCGSFSPEALEPVIKPLIRDLNVHTKVKDRPIQGWVQVEVSGEDEAVALQLLHKKFGLAPIHADNVHKFSLLRGRIICSNKALDELHVDVGVFTPKVVYANIPLYSLQSQLADGKKLSLQSLIQLYSLYDNIPLHIKIVNTKMTENRDSVEAELSEQQLRLFTSWLSVSLDRLIIVGARLQDVDRAVKASGHFHDVPKIESLGLLVHAAVCKLGTDAVGLIPALGRYLRKARFFPFSPRRIRKQIIDRYIL